MATKPKLLADRDKEDDLPYNEAPPRKRIRLSNRDDVMDIFKNQSKATATAKSASSKIGRHSRMLSASLRAPKSSQTMPNPASQTRALTSANDSTKNVKRILIQFRSRDGTKAGDAIDIPIGFTPDKLQLLVNTLLNQSDDPLPYAFFYQPSIEDTNTTIEEVKTDKDESDETQSKLSSLYINSEIVTSLRKFIQTENRNKLNPNQISTENIINIIYEPQAIFRVRPIGRCTAELPGHTEAILSVCFRPDCAQVASGSGDTTIRLWDVNSQSPEKICKGHKNWVLVVEYSPDGNLLASGDMNGMLWLWDVWTGKPKGGAGIQAHKKWVTSIAWEPFHINPKSDRVATAGKDRTIKVWNTRTRRVQFSLSGHTDAVQCIKWGGEGYIYSCSRDRSIRCWNPNNGTCIRQFHSHAHWVNHIALSTEHSLRTGPFDYTGNRPASDEDAVKQAKERYEKAKDVRGEIMVSASDDFTLYLWNPLRSDKPVCRMTGHQQLVNHVQFSPDGRFIASASFDKSVRIWDGLTGKLICRLLGHVQSVYQICWSADSRMLASASRDSTVKIWNLSTRKMVADLPGHADEVYAVDWSANGACLASGSKDRTLRMWQP